MKIVSFLISSRLVAEPKSAQRIVDSLSGMQEDHDSSETRSDVQSELIAILQMIQF